MTQDDIIEMARQVGVNATGNEYWPFFIEELEAFAKLVEDKTRQELRDEIVYKWVPPSFVDFAVKAEREACAKVCEELAELSRISDTDSMWEWGECAAAIRARGNV